VPEAFGGGFCYFYCYYLYSAQVGYTWLVGFRFERQAGFNGGLDLVKLL
jgi:hypothetical protein